MTTPKKKQKRKSIDAEALKTVLKHMQKALKDKQEDYPPEFVKIVDKHFWKLLA